MASLLSENNIEFDETELEASTHDEKRVEKAEKERDDEKKQDKRTSNSNTPPSMAAILSQRLSNTAKRMQKTTDMRNG